MNTTSGNVAADMLVNVLWLYGYDCLYSGRRSISQGIITDLA